MQFSGRDDASGFPFARQRRPRFSRTLCGTQTRHKAAVSGSRPAKALSRTTTGLRRRQIIRGCPRLVDWDELQQKEYPGDTGLGVRGCPSTSAVRNTSQHRQHTAPTRSISLPVREQRRPQGVRRTRAVNSFAFRGQTCECNTAREVLSRVFKRLAEEDPDFCEKFARTHSYLVKDQGELYPAQPLDFVEKNSTGIAPGWWPGMNHGRDRIQQILNSALEVADPGLRAVIQINIGA